MAADRYSRMLVLTKEELGNVPEEIKILPTGRVNSERGKFLVDEEAFLLMKTEMQRRGIDIVIDYEHQTLRDVQAPAAGWVKGLTYTPEAITAKVEWTPKAQEYLKNKEYRYISPVVLVRKTDGRAVALHSLALTNTPAINGMFAIANSVDFDTDLTRTGGIRMDLQKIRELLGLAADASEEEIMSALLEKLSSRKTEEGKEVVANSVILGLLGLPEGARTEDVTSKIMALKAGTDTKAQEVEAMLKRLEEKEADDAVTLALKAGKITAAQQEWAKEYALKDRSGFTAFVEKAPVVVPVGKIKLTDAPKSEQAVDKLVLKATGMSREDVEKYADREEDDE